MREQYHDRDRRLARPGVVRVAGQNDERASVARALADRDLVEEPARPGGYVAVRFMVKVWRERLIGNMDALNLLHRDANVDRRRNQCGGVEGPRCDEDIASVQ